MARALTLDHSNRPAEGPIRVAVLGTGFGAAVHLPAIQQVPELRAIAVCSRRPERAHTVAREFRVPMATTDFRELVKRPEVDAVIVATPPHLHHAMTLAALDAGKHVLCEKPMARTFAEARDMAKMAERAGVAAMVNHEFRFVPARAFVKELIDSGFIGAPYSVSMTFYRSSLNDPNGVPFTWLMEADKAGGMLGAIGSHHLDTLRWWFGEVKSVSGATSTTVKRRRLPDSTQQAIVDADDNFAVVLRFVNGALGTVHYSATATHEPPDHIVVSGSSGMLLLGPDGRVLGGQGGAPLKELMLPEHLLRGASIAGHPLIAPTSLLLRAWVQAIRSGTQSAPSFTDGLRVQELLDAVGRSAQAVRSMELGRGRFA
jgi:predicted dehydrogenase